MSEFTSALDDVKKVDVEARRNCLTTLVKVMQNIVDNKDEEKYRKIKMSNAAFTKKVAECQGGTEVMLAVGFAPDEIDGVDYWVFNISNYDSLKTHFLPKLNEAIKALPAVAPPAPAPV